MMQLVRLVLVLVSLVALPDTARPQGDQATALVQQGQQLAAQGRCRDALAYFDRARRVDPRNHRAWYELGGCYADLRQLDRAIPAFDEAIKLAPNEGLYWGRRSHAKRDRGDLEGALSDMDTALTIDWDNSFAYVVRGSVFLHMGRVRDARLDFEHAQLEVTRRPKVARWKPQVDHFIREFWGERPNWTERPQPRPPDADGVSLQRALDHLRNRRWRRALAYLDVAVEVLPRDPVVRLARGQAFYHVNQYARALEDLGEAIRLAPALPEPYMWRGRVRTYRFEHAGAVEDETRAIQLRPGWAEPYYWRARFNQFAFFHDRWPDALKDWEVYLRLERDPKRLALANRFAGSVHFRRGDHRSALPHFQKALELDPTLGVAHCDIAQIARASNQRAQMEQHLAKCRALDPEAGQWYDTDIKTADKVDAALRDAAAAVWQRSGSDPLVSAAERAKVAEKINYYETHGMRREAEDCRRAVAGSGC